MNRNILRACFIMSLAAQVLNAGDKDSNFLYIFDASGSMMGMMENETKFDVAKKIVFESIEKLPAGVGVGLFYFGNKVKGDECVFYGAPVSPESRSQVVDIIGGLQAGGLTPLARTITLSAETLNKAGVDATFILVTDGQDECGGNPVQAIKDLAKKGIMVEMHIIGLAVSSGVRDQLDKIAATSGGCFYDAANAKQLKDSMDTITDSKLGEQILKLTAAAGIVRTSKNLRSMVSGETLKIKFKPIEALGKIPGERSMLYFYVENIRIELEDKGGEWMLYKREGRVVEKMPWPEGLDVKHNNWNVIAIDGSSKQNVFSINEKRIFSFPKEPAGVGFKVGVEGYDCSFKDLTTQLPLY